MIRSFAKVRDDVFDENVDERMAPNFVDFLLGEADEIYLDPKKFVETTYFTDSMKKILADVALSLEAERGKVIVLYSLYGGGKTHTLIALYHMIRAPEILHNIVHEALNLKDKQVLVIGIDGYKRTVSPSPESPLKVGGYTVRTLWGYIAHNLGRYDLIRKYDETLTPPDVSAIEEMLRGRRVLILMDEVARYIQSFRSSADEQLRGYANSMLIFMENLANAVQHLSTVLVVTLPLDVQSEAGGGKVVEAGYEDTVSPLTRRVEKFATSYPSPVASERDLVEVLKKRIFEHVDAKGKEDAVRRLSALMQEFREYVDESLVSEVEENYPFHPRYLYLLRTLISRVGLQKTRDAIKITRKVVRRLFSSKIVEKRMLIMPFDIDLRDPSLKSKLITPDFQEYDSIFDQMVKVVEENVKDEHDREIFYYIALYIFLSTFPYKPDTSAREVYPTGKQILSAVYEPNLMDFYMKTPKDVYDALENITGKSASLKIPHLVSDSERYWFTAYPDPISIVKDRAREIPDSDALVHIKDKAEEISSKYVDERSAQPKSIREYRTLSEDVVFVLLSSDKLIEFDGEKYGVIVLLKPPEEGDLRNLIFNRVSGTLTVSRSYPNTLAVLYPSRSKWDSVSRELLRDAKEMMACESVDLERMYSNEKVREFMRKQVTSYKTERIKAIYYRLLNMFDRIAYPTFDVDSRVNIVKEDDTVSGKKTLLGLAEDSLIQDAKILNEGDFNVLAQYLSNAGVDIRGGSEIQFKDLRAMFYSNPILPMVSDEILKEALRNGVRKCEIGVRRGAKIFYKKVGSSEGDLSFNDFDLRDFIVPWQVAAEKGIEEFSREEERIEGETIIVKYYVIRFGDEEYKVSELKKRFPDTCLEMFKTWILEEKTQTFQKGFKIQIQPENLVAKAGEEVVAKVSVMSVGAFKGEVKLDAILDESKCSLSKDTIVLDENNPSAQVEVSFKAPTAYGIHYVKVSAECGGTVKSATLAITVAGEKMVTGLVYRGKDLTTAEKIAKTGHFEKVLDEFKIIFNTANNSSVEIKFSNVDINTILLFSKQGKTILGPLTTTIDSIEAKYRIKNLSEEEKARIIENLRSEASASDTLEPIYGGM